MELDFTLTPRARRLRPVRRRRRRLVVGQRRPAARLGAGRRLGPRPVRPVHRRDARQPRRRHHRQRLRAGGLTVLMTGDQAEPSPPRDGRRTWTSTDRWPATSASPPGEFTTAEAATPGGVAGDRRRPPEGRADAGRAGRRHRRGDRRPREFLGPFPYGTLTRAAAARLRRAASSTRASILQASRSRVVLVHEVAHMWFYGMVGNSQFRDPWLDEAFATWAEAVVDRVGGRASRRRAGAARATSASRWTTSAATRQYFAHRLRQGRRGADRGPRGGRRRGVRRGDPLLRRRQAWTDRHARRRRRRPRRPPRGARGPRGGRRPRRGRRPG